MSDIMTSDNAKMSFRIIRRMLSSAGETKKAHADLRDCTNPVFKKIYLELMKTASKIDRGHQQRIVADIGAWLLWVIYKDTAYNPITLYIMKEILKDENIIKEINKQAVDTTDDLYVNRWNNTLKNTRYLHEKGYLNKHQLSSSEDIFVPVKQHDKHLKMSEEEILKEVKNEMRKRVRKR